MSEEIMDNAVLLPLSYAHLTLDTQRYVKNLIDYFESTKDQQDSRMTYLFVSYLFPYLSSIDLGLMLHSIYRMSFFDRKDKPTSRLAAVLVLLFEKHGHLRVLLTTRAKQLRTHGGETSLPGGKMEDGDRDIITTAVSLGSFSMLLQAVGSH